MFSELSDTSDRGRVRGWVLYDAACPLCRRLRARVAGVLEAGGFRSAPLQSARVRERLKLPQEALLSEMRLLTRQGRVLGGADALVHLAAALPPRLRPGWAWLLLVARRMPFGMPLLRRSYRAIAARRTCRQGACPLSVPRVLTRG